MFIDTFRFNLKLREYHVIVTKIVKKLLISILHFLNSKAYRLGNIKEKTTDIITFSNELELAIHKTNNHVGLR